jgi:hypothetical protein
MIKRKLITVYLSTMLSFMGAGPVLAQDPTQESKPDCAGPVYKAREVSKRAKITSFPPPKTSNDRRAGEVQDRVVLKVVLCRTGQVTNFEVIERLPYGITEKAIEAALRVQFVPAEKDGQRVSQGAIFEYNTIPN